MHPLETVLLDYPKVVFDKNEKDGTTIIGTHFEVYYLVKIQHPDIFQGKAFEAHMNHSELKFRLDLIAKLEKLKEPERKSFLSFINEWSRLQVEEVQKEAAELAAGIDI